MSEKVREEDIFRNPSAEKIIQLLKFDGSAWDYLESISQADWERLLSNAIWFGLAPLIYIRINASNLFKRIPPEVFSTFKNQYLLSSAKGLKRRHELEELLTKFQEAAIPVLVLKGAHLAEEVYQDPALRLMTDLDLMVARNDLEQASKVLVNNGFQPLKAFLLDFETTISHQLPIFTRTGRYPVELHWSIMRPDLPFPIDLFGVWERAKSIQIGDVTMRVLCNEDLLLHLSLHAAAQHRLTGGLRLIFDIASVLDHYKDEMDWQAVLNRCEEWNAKTAVYLVFQLTKSVYGIGVPAEVEEALRPSDFDDAWVELARDLLTLNREFHPHFPRNLAVFVETKKLNEKIGMAWKRLFPSAAAMAAKYPVLPKSPRLWLYYPLHWKALLIKHLGTIRGLANKDESTVDASRWAYLVQNREDYLKKQIITPLGVNHSL